jgi:hypothetical protein
VGIRKPEIDLERWRSLFGHHLPQAIKEWELRNTPGNLFGIFSDFCLFFVDFFVVVYSLSLCLFSYSTS